MCIRNLVFLIKNLDEGIGLEDSALYLKRNPAAAIEYGSVYTIRQRSLIEKQKLELKIKAQKDRVPSKRKRRKIKPKERLLKTAAWKKLRKEIIAEQGGACLKCGELPEPTNLHIDHIKPYSKYPELVFCKDNLQVLCKRCNFAKSFTDETDYRKSII